MNDPRKLNKALADEQERLAERKKLLDSTAPDPASAGGDSNLPAHNRNAPVEKNAHISQKVYLFPEEYNALRRELEDHWATFFHAVNPMIGTSPAHAMVFDAPTFIGLCNGALDMTVQLDTDNVAGICKQFLNGFRKLRGVSPL